MPDGVSPDRTRSTAVTDAEPALTRTRTIDELVEDAGYLRSVTRMLGEDVAATNRRAGELHHQAFAAQLNSRARQIAKRGALDILGELAAAGFAWRDIARLVGVSVPGLRRWRQGEQPTGANLLALARLLSFVEILKDDHFVASVPSWLEMPLVDQAPVTGMDLAAAGRFEDLLDLAANHENSAGDVLDRWQPDWRDRYRSDFEVFTAADGQTGIRVARVRE